VELIQHPLSAAFPSMSVEDFQALKDDIETNGQHEPVMLYEGMVLDGWHRYRACAELGVKVKQFTFADGDPVAYVESANLHRRHLTASQRAAAVVAVRAWAPAKRPAEAAKNKGAAAAPLSTNKDMAKAANVSVRTIKDAKAGHKAGLSEAMKEGALTAEQAANIARGKPEPTQAPKKHAPWNKPEPTLQPALDEAQEAVAILSEENDRLNDRLAVEAMDASEEEKSQAKDTIESLRAQVKTLSAELDAVKASRDSHMRECAELKKQCASYRKQLDKLKATA
jgi:regulator of replication initiation timing